MSDPLSKQATASEIAGAVMSGKVKAAAVVEAALTRIETSEATVNAFTDVVADRARKRAAEIHFGMIFGPSIRELYEQHGADLTSYARHLVEASAKIAKDDLIAGLDLEGRIYAPLGALLEDYDVLICPTFAVPALPATYEVGDPVEINGEPIAHWMDTMMTLPFNIASRCPVLSVPSGLSRDGVPTGLSVVGKTYDDVAAFRVAAAHEVTFPWLDEPGRRPGSPPG